MHTTITLLLKLTLLTGTNKCGSPRTYIMAESPKDAHGRTTSGEAAHVELDRTNFLANPVFACEALPGLPKS